MTQNEFEDGVAIVREHPGKLFRIEHADGAEVFVEFKEDGMGFRVWHKDDGAADLAKEVAEAIAAIVAPGAPIVDVPETPLQ